MTHSAGGQILAPGLDRTTSAVVLGLVAFLVMLPLGYLFYGALMTGAPGQQGSQFTLENFRIVYATGKYLSALGNSLRLSVAVTVLTTVVGTLFAWLIARTDIPGRRVIELLILVPMFLSPLLGALAWIALAAPGSGFINAFARTFLDRAADSVDVFSFHGIVFVMFLYFVPYSYLFVVGTLKNMDPALEDAARMTGAGVFGTMRRVTLPLVMPAIFSSALLVFVLAAELFSVPTMLGARVRFDTIPMLIYLGYQFSLMPVGEASALATLLMWITLGGIFLYRRMVALSRRYVTVSGKGLKARRIALGAWRYPALVLIGLYLAAAVVLPYLALVLGSTLRFLTPKLRPELFTLDNYVQLLQPAQWVAFQNTLVLAVCGATATTVLAFLVSFLIVRSRGRLTVALDYLGSLPAAVPSMAMAIGLLWAYTMLPLPIYGTIAMLFIAYLTRFIPYGMRIGSSGIQQIDPELEEAGRVIGLSSLGTFRRITLPLLKPSVMSAWTLIFIFIVVEITATIMLYTSNTKTLSVVMWLAVDMGGSVAAFTVGVVQSTLVLCALAVAFWLARSLRAGVE